MIFWDNFLPIEKLQQLNDKLRGLGHKEVKLLRIYGRIYEKKDFPDPFDLVKSDAPKLESKGNDSNCLPKFKVDALHHKIRDRNEEIQEDENKFFKTIRDGILPASSQKKKWAMGISFAMGCIC